MNQRLAPGLTIARSRIHGKGCFAAILFRQNQQIAEYVGERIAMAEAARRRCAAGEQCICDVDAEWAIDGSRGGNGTQYVNHSCQPNSDVIVLRGQVFLYALREITPGEEITTDYLYELGLEGTRCKCRRRSGRENMSPAGTTGDSAGQASERPDRQSPYLTLLWGGACEGNTYEFRAINQEASSCVINPFERVLLQVAIENSELSLKQVKRITEHDAIF